MQCENFSTVEKVPLPASSTSRTGIGEIDMRGADRHSKMEPKRGIRIIWAKNGVELGDLHHAKLKRISSLRL